MGVQYHCYDSCNKCSAENEVKITDTLESHILECETVCKECGFQDYWAHGFYESSKEMVSNCKTYSFDKD